MGLDLYQDLDPEALLTDDTTPPLLRRLGVESRFTRIPVNSELTGDITKSSTSELIQKCVGNDAIYVLDIPLPSRETVLSAISTLSLAEAAARVAIRILGSHRKLLDVLGYCAKVDSGTQLVITHWGHHGGEAWAILTIQRALPKTQYHVEIPALPVLAPTDDPLLTHLGGGPDYLLESLYGPYVQMREGDEQTVLSATELLVGASVGELEHRFTYTQFTDLLSAVVISQCHHHPDWLRQAQDILTQDTTTVMIAGHRAQLSISPRLRRLLTHTLPRLM
jgi:hypothetical protein